MNFAEDPVLVKIYIDDNYQPRIFSLMETIIEKNSDVFIPSDENALYDTNASDNINVIVVGAGPIGMHFCNYLIKVNENVSISIFNGEGGKPYNRSLITKYLSRVGTNESMYLSLPKIGTASKFRLINTYVSHMDTREKVVTDNNGMTYGYDRLVLATGAEAVNPFGIDNTTEGIFTLRGIDDLYRYYHISDRLNRVAVLGGGVLGVETSLSLCDKGMNVSIIHNGPHLLHKQINNKSGELIEGIVEKRSIKILRNKRVSAISECNKIFDVCLDDGANMQFDAVFICIGVKPSKDIAEKHCIRTANGIIVDDRMQTSCEDIYAIGDCSEHNGVVYGTLNTGYKQAELAADHISNRKTKIETPITDIVIKFPDKNVRLLVNSRYINININEAKQIKWKNGDEQRILNLYKDRIISCLSIENIDWCEKLSSKHQIDTKINMVDMLLFRSIGIIRALCETKKKMDCVKSGDIVCKCRNVTKETIEKYVVNDSLEKTLLKKETGLGSVCGTCLHAVDMLFNYENGNKMYKNMIHVISIVIILLLVTILTTPFSHEEAGIYLLFDEINGYFGSEKTSKTLTGILMTLLFAYEITALARQKIRNKSNRMSMIIGNTGHIVVGALALIVAGMHTQLEMPVNNSLVLLVCVCSISVIGVILLLINRWKEVYVNHMVDGVSLGLKYVHKILCISLGISLILHVISVYYF